MLKKINNTINIVYNNYEKLDKKNSLNDNFIVSISYFCKSKRGIRKVLW